MFPAAACRPARACPAFRFKIRQVAGDTGVYGILDFGHRKTTGQVGQIAAGKGKACPGAKRADPIYFTTQNRTRRHGYEIIQTTRKPREVSLEPINEVSVLPVVADLAAANKPRAIQSGRKSSSGCGVKLASRMNVLPRRTSVQPDVPASPRRRSDRRWRRGLDRHIGSLSAARGGGSHAASGSRQQIPFSAGDSVNSWCRSPLVRKSGWFESQLC